jgi:hypothetical protein
MLLSYTRLLPWGKVAQKIGATFVNLKKTCPIQPPTSEVEELQFIIVIVM